MIQQILRRFLSLFLSAVLIVTLLPVISVPALAAANGTLNLSNPYIHASYSGDEAGKWEVKSGNGITGSVSGEDNPIPGCSGTSYKTTLTITNKKDTDAILSFDYTIGLNDGTIKVAGTTVNATGHYSETIGAGGSITIELISSKTSNDTTINITNLSLIADVEVTTTFQPAENGSYTVDGIQITEETVKTQQSTIAYNLSATANPGYKFVGWYSETNNTYLSTANPASLQFDSNQTVTAIFTEQSNPVFDVGGAKFTDLNEADNYASSNSIEKITLVSDGTLTSGNYTISEGVILLIPFDEANTCYTTEPETTHGTYTTPSEFKKLTLASGASITVRGAVSVSAKHYAVSGGRTGGTTTGPYGHIVMEAGSQMIVTQSGKLYVYGYITGGGEITAQPGAEVYELFEVQEFRGGWGALDMLNNKERVFFLSQYYIQNIQSSLTIYSGASLRARAALYASNTTATSTVTVIGETDGLFLLGSGSITKKYVPAEDRCQLDIRGNMSISSVVLEAMGATLDSSAYVLPINGQFDINLLTGTTTISKDVEFLPGVRLTIHPEATLNIDEGCSLYLYDSDEWMQGNYVFADQKLVASAYAPNREYIRNTSDLTDVRMDVNGTVVVNGALYTTEGGANIVSSEETGKIQFQADAGTSQHIYQAAEQTGSGVTTKVSYDEIPITSAKLHNGEQYAGTDGEYTLTDDAEAGTTYKYCTSCGKWYTGTHTVVTFVVDGKEQASKTCTSDGTVTYTGLTEEPVAVTITDADGNVLTEATPSWADDPKTLTVSGLSGATAIVAIATTSVAEIVSSDGTMTDEYATLQAAVTAYDGTGYIQLTADVTEESVTIDRDVYLDLNGHTVNGTVTISDGTLYGMDSSSDGYAAPTGSITTVTGGTPELVVETTGFKSSDEYAFFRYLAIQDENGWSFHRFNISVTGYRFELAASSAPECALFFIARFSGDELVRNQLQKIEITMAEGGKEIKGPVFTDKVTAAEWEETETGYLFEARIVRAFSGENAGRYEVPITASSKATFANGGTRESEQREITYLEAWENVAEISPDQRQKLDDFLAGLQNSDETE